MAGKINKNKVATAAAKYVSKGQIDKAIREYRKIVEDDPRDVRVWLKIGDLQAKKGKNADALETYGTVAEFFIEQGLYLKAVAVYKQILPITPDRGQVHMVLAELYKQLGLLSEAMKQYELVSSELHNSGRTREALAAVRQIVLLDPNNVASRIKLAELYSREDMTEEAVLEFAQAAEFLRKNNRLNDFIKVAERALYLQPDNVVMVKSLARVYMARNDPRRSLQKLQAVFKADPSDEETLDMLADCFQKLGQVTKTISVLKESARIALEKGDPDKRLQIFERILTLNPADQDAKKAMSGESQPSVPKVKRTYTRPITYADPDTGIVDDVPSDVESIVPNDEPVYGTSDFEVAQVEPIAQIEQVPPVEQVEPVAQVEQVPPASMASPMGPIGDEAYPPSLGEEDRTPLVEPESQPGDSPVSPSPNSNVAKILDEAEVYIKYGLTDKAITHLEQTLKGDPYNTDLRLKLRDVYVQQKNYPLAARELGLVAYNLVNDDPSTARRLLNEAQQLHPQDEYSRTLLVHLDTVEAAAQQQPAADIQPMEQQPVEQLPVEMLPAQAAEFVDPEPAAIQQEYVVSDDVLVTDDGLAVDEVALHTEFMDVDDTAVPGQFDEASTEADVGGAIWEPEPDMPDMVDVDDYNDGQVTRPGGGRGGGISEDLEEADFFVQQSLFDEARAILNDLLQRYPDHPLVQSKLEDLAEAEADVSQFAHQPSIKAERLEEDVAAVLAEQPVEELEADLPGKDEGEALVDDIFEEVKQHQPEEVADEDAETHYDLGFAYREMGLLDEAIKEFEVAKSAPGKEVLCQQMIGLCWVDKGSYTEAISRFKQGLYVDNITPRETIALYFELGQAYEALDDSKEALYYFTKVAKRDAKFRKVDERIAVLGGEAVESGGDDDETTVDQDVDDTDGSSAPKVV